MEAGLEWEWWFGPFAKDKDTCIHLLSKNLLNICNVLHSASMVEAERASFPRNFQNFLKLQNVKSDFKFIMFFLNNAYL